MNDRYQPSAGYRASQPPEEEISLGIWGATGSGKTTFLATLRLAAEQADPSRTRWNVVAEGETLQVVTRWTSELINDKRFPAASDFKRDLDFTLVGRQGARQPRRTGGGAVDGVFKLRLFDVSGTYYDDRTSFGAGGSDEGSDDLEFFPDGGASNGPGHRERNLEAVVEHLAECKGIVYLFDPVAQIAEDNAFRNFNAMLGQVEARAWARGRLNGPEMPHHVAVCVTKFDDPAVLSAALRPEELAELRGSPGPIRIPSEIARRYFKELCAADPYGAADYVRNAIDAHFHGGRVKVFATSSIGPFYGTGGRFDPSDPANVIHNGEAARLRGQVRPMNVLEPVVWLVKCIMRAESLGQGT